MRRFRFRLEPLRRLRSQLERAARRELARATSALHTVDQQLAAAAHGRREFGEQAALGGPTGHLARALESGLTRHQWRLQARQRRAASQLDAVRVDYLRKARELGALEKFEERRREDWRIQRQRDEQEELDELARMVRQNGEAR